MAEGFPGIFGPGYVDEDALAGRVDEASSDSSSAPAPAPAPAPVPEVTPTPSTTTGAGDLAGDPSAFIAELKSLFPWIDELGLEPAWFQEVAATSAGADEAVMRLRQAPQYQARFPGLYRSDGSIRMNEAQYLARENDYRQVLRQAGFDMSNYEKPSQLVGFFEGEIDPNELQQRVVTYRQVEQSSQQQRDAFYVYAGLDVGVDDLYEAVVDPAARQRLADEYNRAVASQAFDYETWITRATEVGLQRVADQLTVLQSRGAVTSRAVQAVLSVDTGFARQIMDAIYTGGAPGDDSSTLSLEDVLSSFEYAAIGAAARNSGLVLPDKERLAEIRAAGVERRQAIESYMAFGRDRERLSAASEAAGFGGITQDEFERGAFLGDAGAARELDRAVAREEASGRSAGAFRFSEDRGRLVQRGFGRT